MEITPHITGLNYVQQTYFTIVHCQLMKKDGMFITGDSLYEYVFYSKEHDVEC